MVASLYLKNGSLCLLLHYICRVTVEVFIAKNYIVLNFSYLAIVMKFLHWNLNWHLNDFSQKAKIKFIIENLYSFEFSSYI